MHLRCRGPAGLIHHLTVDIGMSIAEFQSVLKEKTGITADRQEIMAGFPPQLIQLPADMAAPLSSLPIQSGDLLVIRETEEPAEPSNAPATSAAKPTQPPIATEDEDLARAIAASLGEAFGAGPAEGLSAHEKGEEVTMSSTQPAALRPSQQKGAATAILLPDGTAVVRRIIDSDNSCLFNAVGGIIVDTVAGDPDTYSEGFLGKTNPQYCAWIRDAKHWGGAIELSILSRQTAPYYGREIAAHDIQTERVDIYGQDAGYSERAMLIYDGLHYDALALAAFEGASEELDVTIFSLDGVEAAEIAKAAGELVHQAHVGRQFTDVARFTLRCGSCQIGVKGEAEARQHAASTGHTNFVEYH